MTLLNPVARLPHQHTRGSVQVGDYRYFGLPTARKASAHLDSMSHITHALLGAILGATPQCRGRLVHQLQTTRTAPIVSHSFGAALPCQVALYKLRLTLTLDKLLPRISQLDLNGLLFLPNCIVIVDLAILIVSAPQVCRQHLHQHPALHSGRYLLHRQLALRSAVALVQLFPIVAAAHTAGPAVRSSRCSQSKGGLYPQALDEQTGDRSSPALLQLQT